MASSADRRLVAGCLLGSFAGTVAPAWLIELVREGLGGVLLFAQNVVDDAQVAALCATLRDANPTVIIAIDEEGGDVTRLDARLGSSTPCPAAFGFVDDEVLTRAAYASLGRRVHALGIDLTLAPCLDINSNPLNPIIGVRSFGATPSIVRRHGSAAVAGFRSGGLAVAVKHFPGHGDTTDDTHLGTARVDAGMATLGDRELVPFVGAIADGVDAIMTAHIVATALDTQPVSLSAAWTAHLRHQLGFDGVIVTDALDMDGVAGGRGIEGVADAAVRALGAGADLLCVGSNFDDAMTSTVIDRAVAAVASGGIDRAQLDASRQRIGALRLAGADDSAPMSSVAARQVADAAIVVDGQVPAGPYAVIECRPRLSMASFNVAWGVAEIVGNSGWPTIAVSAADPIDDCVARFVANTMERPLLVVVRDAGVHCWQQDVIATCAAARPDAVVAEMGWPPETRPVCGAFVVTHGAARSSSLALIDRLTSGEK